MKSIRKTKVIATIGPACDAQEILQEMMLAGMNVARINMSHGSYDEHRNRIKTVRAVAQKVDKNIAIMVDTKGIEIRTGLLKAKSVELVTGNNYKLYCENTLGDEHGVSVTHSELYKEVKVDTQILINDGAIELKVLSIDNKTIECKIIYGGYLSNSKGVNLPDVNLQEISIYDACKDDLTFAVDQNADYIAASFVRSADDIKALKDILLALDSDIPIIAKIENKSGVTHLESILDACDGIMVARGDLGVEVSVADVPSIQKRIIRTTVMNGKPVITATQMLDSMERNNKPTRAEASDVANAILDGTSAVMLSGETAIGKYPIESVKTMTLLANKTEDSLSEYGFLQKTLPSTANIVTEAVSQAVITMAKHLNASAIIALTETGFTSRMISKYRPECPIFAITTSDKVVRKLTLNWGVYPIIYQGDTLDMTKINFAIEKIKSLGLLKSKDIVIAAHGQSEKAGGTNLIRAVVVE